MQGIIESSRNCSIFSMGACKPALPMWVSKTIHTDVDGVPGSGYFPEKKNENKNL